MPKATIDDLEVGGRRVLLRVDFNVPMRDGAIVDDLRIREALPTIRTLSERGARTIVVAHLGRPKGKVDESLTLRPIAQHLAASLGAGVRFAGDVGGEESQLMAAQIGIGEVGMLENVRFEPGEERNDPEFARRLAELADVYVDDAFGAAHRAHASTEGVAHLLPAVAGYLMAKELDALSSVLNNPMRPLVAIVGGAKISTKVAVVEHLLDRVDVLWIGGAMACTFYRAEGVTTGRSLVEEEEIPTARRLLDIARHTRGRLELPSDVVVTDEIKTESSTAVTRWDSIPDSGIVVDIGPESCERIAADVASAGTVVWNGPLGIYEIEAFAQGTRRVARALAGTTAYTVVGGGDLAAAVQDAGVADKIDHISTGGGATIEYLEGRTLPGVAVLMERSGTAA
ncbi:MAG: phosphoglycerate kinase [Candidatus Dormibacteraeota bacterium]|nr:phosphoglycerate kinase [Candidatus Dormibacteraeota bacterium]